MYPKVKVKEQIEEVDQYAFEKSSLSSLKAFEWLSLRHLTPSDESSKSKVRVPGSVCPKSPPPSFRAYKEEINEKNKTSEEDNRKNVRATSAPRPRAVLSSPVNDAIFGNKKQTRKELFPGLKSPHSNQTHSKVFPRSVAAVISSPVQVHKKEAMDIKSHIRTKVGTSVAESSLKARHQKKVSPDMING